ncbi:restriction endonuclease subunit S [Vibrio alginolyticus]|uniref:restriction endonuclease subunit S n=1 Tax=Vibrio alginolyticus TaxID=663 RepID=UPI001BD5D517|nr:restriction endonuclease subunit S [Vibrio alginolyticus]MBT0090789.1 restriction endonuclease subunit S [Vibrio alginolyticus]
MSVLTENAVPAGYKNSDIGLIPEEWEVVTLNEAANFLDGQRRPIKSSNREKIKGQYPYYGASGVVDYVNDYIFDGEFILLGEDGENILSRVVPLAFRASGKIWVNNHAHVLSPKAEFHIDFLTEYLESLDYTLLNSGTAQPKLNKQSCLSIKVAKPPYSEQTSIARAISDVDSLLNKLEKLIAKKQAIKTASMQQLLTGKKRLPEFALHTEGEKKGQPKGMKRSELGEIPEDWSVVTIGDCLKIRHGRSQKEVESANGVYPILATGGQIGLANSYLYDKPSVLIGRKGTINRPRYVERPFWTVDTLFYSEVAPDANAKFTYYKFCMIDWMQYNEASGVPSLNASTIEGVLIAVPDLQEQTAIAAVLSDMDDEIQALEKRLSKTRKIKQGMMQELLTGRTRLPFDKS